MPNAIDTNRERDIGMSNLISSQSDGGKRPGQESANVAEKAKELASAVSEKSKELAAAMAQSATSMAKDAASTVAQKASDVAGNIGRKAGDATTAVGGSLKSLAQTVRERGPHDGMMGSTTSAVASTLENSGAYLEEQGLQGMAEDLSAFIRRYPLQSVLAGIGIGFCLARFTSSRR